MNKIAYICDQKRNCGRFEHCQVDCFHTTDEFHAKNGIVQHIDDLSSDRFIFLGTVNETSYYMEVKHDDERYTVDEDSAEG